MYSQVQDMTVTILLFSTQRMAARNPAARSPVSRLVTDWARARLANMVQKTQMR